MQKNSAGQMVVNVPWEGGGSVSALEADVKAIKEKIPITASKYNQLADKQYVDDSVKKLYQHDIMITAGMPISGDFDGNRQHGIWFHYLSHSSSEDNMLGNNLKETEIAENDMANTLAEHVGMISSETGQCWFRLEDFLSVIGWGFEDFRGNMNMQEWKPVVLADMIQVGESNNPIQRTTDRGYAAWSSGYDCLVVIFPMFYGDYVYGSVYISQNKFVEELNIFSKDSDGYPMAIICHEV